MTVTWLAPQSIYANGKLHHDVVLPFENGKTGEVCKRTNLPQNAIEHKLEGILTAGFIDLQVNGGGNVLFNNDQSVKAIQMMRAAHFKFGTVGILPTLITDAPEVLARAVDAAIAAKDCPGILGLHIEGPHVSHRRRGTHADKWIRPFEEKTLEHVKRLRSHGIFVLITAAPEAVTPRQISQIVATGAVVSIGHSDATAHETRVCLAAGASVFTHLYNAMSPMMVREPGVTGACITSTAYAGIICDGIHVADEMVEIALRARPRKGLMFLVSDAMSTVGGSDHFTLYGRELRLEDGRLVNAEGSLAGAHTTMAEGMKRLISVIGIDPEEALDMCISAPARILGRSELAEPCNRTLADLILLDSQWRAKQVPTNFSA